jgi:hypothetical protein
MPEQQPEKRPRERSIEHERLTPVFGTSAPLRGASGAIRRLAYARYSEARAAHWLLLLAADRVDAKENLLRSLLTGRPDNPVTETGVLSERSGHGLRSRVGRRRADVGHHLLDPLVVGTPWVASAVVAGWLGYRVVRSVGSRRS